LLNLQANLRVTPIVGDTYFHYSRFYDAAMQIRHWNFSYFQTNYGFDQSGRIINAMYGPLFAYGMGLLLLIVHSWFRFKLISAFLLAFIGTSGMYALCLRATKKQGISLLASLTYLGVSNLTLWQSVSNFRAVSAMLAPFVMMCAWRMLTDHQRPISWLQLGVTMAVVGQVHLLSCFIFATALLPFFIVGLLKADNRKQVWLNFGGAIALALILTMNVWLVLLHFFTSEKIFTPDAMNLAFSSLRLTDLPHEISVFTTETLLVLTLLNGLYLLLHLQEDKANNWIFGVGLAMLLMSSSLMPWGFIQTKLPVLQTAFQNPKRLMIASDPLLILSLGLTISHLIDNAADKQSVIKPIAISLLGLTCLGGIIKGTNLNNYYSYSARIMKDINHSAYSRDLSLLFKYCRTVASPDYLPQYKLMSNEHAEVLYQKEIINRKQIFDHRVLANGQLEITWVNHLRSAKAKLPIVMYQESRLQTQDKLLSKDAIGVPTVRSKKGLNRAVLAFNAPAWFSPCIIIVLAGWLAAIFALLFGKRLRLLKDARA
jgi:hypothetical protein